VIDRPRAVEFYRTWAVRHGLVDLDASEDRTSCDGPLIEIPCYAAIGTHAMPQSSQARFDAHRAAVSLARPNDSHEPRFLDQVANACRVKHLAYRTEQSYVSWVKRIILFHGKRHPQEMGPIEVRAFLTHLAVNRTVSASTQNQALNAIAFMYREVVRRDPGEFGEFDRAKRSTPGSV
jgi:hypothetical protein